MKRKIYQQQVVAAGLKPKRIILGLALLGAMSLLGARTASGATIAFERISSNAGVDISSQLTLNIVDFGGQALFLFENEAGGSAAYINQIYIQDSLGVLSSFDFAPTLSVATQIDYSPNASPSNPPNIAPFVTTYSQDANSPAAKNGINLGETGAFLANTAAFSLVDLALTNGDLRVALHAQGLGAGGEFSDSFLGLPPVDPAVPEPGVVGLILLTGLTLLVRHSRLR